MPRDWARAREVMRTEEARLTVLKAFWRSGSEWNEQSERAKRLKESGRSVEVRGKERVRETESSQLRD
jgi:hypothetical protein